MYYSLVYLDDEGRWGMEVGDYESSVVEDERDAMRDSGRNADARPPAGMPRYHSLKRFKILRHRNARQSTINKDVAKINKDHVAALKIIAERTTT